MDAVVIFALCIKSVPQKHALITVFRLLCTKKTTTFNMNLTNTVTSISRPNPCDFNDYYISHYHKNIFLELINLQQEV